MVARVSLTTTTDGTVVVVKTALSGDREDRRAEAQWLADAAQIDDGRIGVVPLHGLDDDPFVSIVTHRVAGDTLRTRRATPPEAASILLETIEVLSNLHRHGLVHGKLSLDHVIVSADGPVLCSPTGRAGDVGVDSIGLAGCIRSLLVRWDDDSVAVPDLDLWVDLADALADDETPLPLRRAARRLRGLVSSDAHPVNDSNEPRGLRQRLISASSNRRGGGFALVGVVAIAAVGGLGLVDRIRGDASIIDHDTLDGPTVEVDGNRYRIGRPGDQAIALADPCPGQPSVVHFDAGTGSVWWFTELDDGFEPTLVAQVPNGGELRIDRSQSCPEVTIDESEADGDPGTTRIVVPRA